MMLAEGGERTPGRTRRIIVDSQLHLWRPNTADRPWAAGTKAQLPEAMTIERALPMLEEGRVDRVVIVPPMLEGLRIDYGLEAARRYPGRFATMSRIELSNPAEAARLPGLKAEPAVLGVRLNLAGAEAAWLTDGTADWFWPAAERARLPVMVFTRGQTALLAKLAARHPELVLIIDHMGAAPDALVDGTLAARIAEAAALARYANVSVKLTGAPFFSRENYPFADVAPHIHRLVDAYGPRRCFWGTDATYGLERATYRQRVTHFTEELPFLSEVDLDWIMGRAVLEWLDWH